MQKLLPLKHAAVEVGIPYTTLYFHLKAGRIPFTQIGRLCLVEPRVLTAIMDARKYKQRKAQ